MGGNAVAKPERYGYPLVLESLVYQQQDQDFLFAAVSLCRTPLETALSAWFTKRRASTAASVLCLNNSNYDLWVAVFSSDFTNVVAQARPSRW